MIGRYGSCRNRALVEADRDGKGNGMRKASGGRGVRSGGGVICRDAGFGGAAEVSPMLLCLPITGALELNFILNLPWPQQVLKHIRIQSLRPVAVSRAATRTVLYGATSTNHDFDIMGLDYLL